MTAGMDPEPNNLTSDGPGPHPDGQNLSVQPPMSSTPNKPLQELQNVSSVSATTSSEQLGSTIHAAHESTTSVPGFESASTDFHGDVSSDVPPVQQQGQGITRSASDAKMGQDITLKVDTDMDLTHQDAYKRDDENPPAAQPDLNKKSSTGMDPTMQLVAQLQQAQKAGTLADVTNQLHWPQAEQLAELLQLTKSVADPTSAEWGHPYAQNDTGTDSEQESTSQSGGDTESVNTESSSQEGRSSARRRRLASSQVQKLLEQGDKDVIVIDEQVDTDGLKTVHLTPSWGNVSSTKKRAGLLASLPGSNSSNLGWKR